MKIYAVTRGAFEDYHICALTINKEKAERLKELYTDKYNNTYIEIFEDNEGELDLFWFCDKNGRNPKINEYQEKEEVVIDSYGIICGVYVRAEDKAQAEEKAHNMLAEYKAKGENI